MMKKYGLCSLACLLFFSAVFAQPKPDESVVQTPFFKVKFPEKPIADTQYVDSDLGKLSMHLFSVEPQGEEQTVFAYIFMHMQYPDSTIRSSDTAILPMFFKNAIDGAASNVNGVIQSVKDYKLQGYPGKDAEILLNQEDETVIINFRLLLVNNMMLILQTVSDLGNSSSPDVLAFLNSIELLPMEGKAAEKTP